MPFNSIDTALEILSENWVLERAELGDTRRVWRDCDAFGDPADVSQPKFAGSSPSQHERLEALLLWREWLQDKRVSPDFANLWRATIS